MSASLIRTWALALIAWATAGAAHADEWRVCFQPGTEILTPEGYAAAREAAARLEGERSATPRHPASLQVEAPGGPEATDRAARLAREVRLELYRLRVGVIFVAQAQAQGPALGADCVRVALDPRGAPTLWHSVGPYFAPGSAEVTAEWRERLRETTSSSIRAVARPVVNLHAQLSCALALGWRATRKGAGRDHAGWMEGAGRAGDDGGLGRVRQHSQ